MKKFAKAVTAFLLGALLPYLNAQVTLEHTYTGKLMQRVQLENSGEKYYVLDTLAPELHFYHANHTPWKTVSLPLNPGFVVDDIVHVSETVIDPDNNLEIVYKTRTPFGGGVYEEEWRVASEDGQLLLNESNAEKLYIQENENMSPKLIVVHRVSNVNRSWKIYGLPGLQAEHVYTGAGFARVGLENSGEKYYLLNQADAYIQLYNADHNLWKQIDLPLVPGESIIRIEHLSETKFNQDALLEIGYHCQGPGFRNRIANENGHLLLDTACCMGQRLSLIDGLPARLILLPDGFGSTTQYHVYSIPGLTREYTYSSFAFQFDRIRLEGSGEKYVLKNYFSSDLSLYNPDHSLWKTMMFDASPGLGSAGFSHLSETRIDPDNMLEACYIAYNTPLQQSEGWVRKEDGHVFLYLPRATDFRLSELPGLPNKLLATVDTATDNLHVYGLPSSTYVGLEPETLPADGISLYPNPASGSFTLESADKLPENVYLSSLNGAVLKQINVYTNKMIIDVSGLRPGLYLVHGTLQSGRIFHKKVVIR
ncbi:MAG: T9SS type A sorting domain-containing protein [Bacteroidia bacterium]|nr:T9SS type A sorting domain-containing protein [Bacteroidia bacterium]